MGKKINKPIDLYSANYDHPGPPIFLGDHEEILFQGNTTMRIWYNNIPTCYQMHWHNSIEITIPENNYYDMVTPNKTYRLQPGEIMIVPSGYLHACNAPETGTRFIHLFDISLLQKMSGFARLQPILANPLIITKMTHPMIYDDVMQGLAAIRDEYFNQSDFYELTIMSMLINIFTKIGINHQQDSNFFQDEKPTLQKRYIAEFNALLEHIDTHYMDDLNLEDTATKMGFSKYHFSRLFKTYTNFTFCDYVNFRRLKVCEELLENPNLSITEVAMQSGFPSISTFNRLFLEAKGCSPSEFRAKIKDKNKW
ncbi:MAG: AraC family transcriptional regulator [Lachnospiraceae bacterium]|nr:AraC family transcriptional regulator [Lachnospiraceae bacterium]